MKLFRRPASDRYQVCFLPPVLNDVVGPDAPVRILSDVMDQLDITALLESYPGGGAPAYEPRMLLKLLVFSYSEGVRSSRRIAERCVRDTHYMFLTNMSRPDYHTICRFRRRNLSMIADLMKQTVRLCQAAGLVLLEQVAVDGTKLEANVSSKETYNKKRVDDAIAYTQDCIDAILQDAEAQDAAQEGVQNDESDPGG